MRQSMNEHPYRPNTFEWARQGLRRATRPVGRSVWPEPSLPNEAVRFEMRRSS